MRILFFDAKPYDIESFEKTVRKEEYESVRIEYLDADINEQTAGLAAGYDAICAFVSSILDAPVIEKLQKCQIPLILMRCSGFNNVDLDAAKKAGITILRVPGYSPEAVAEHALTLALAVNRRIHKEYIKVRENNFSLVGLMGLNLCGRVAGIVGTGKIGACMAKICHGLGMQVIAYDKFPNEKLQDILTYKSLKEVLAESDLISLHCPLTEENYHMINKHTIDLMKDNVIFINTSRGELVDSNDLIAGIREHKFHGVGLDVYEEERENVFENREDDILESSIVSRLLSFPNVIVTSHQAFFTEEALAAISETTLKNAIDFAQGSIEKMNQVV
ncbi:MAG: 2-hydroxyacid dehydrogenase [Lachnospiraceae bacterium]|nr:2-hydroxyacid dehydrogenase [Lachnospiraceae bacterium]